MIQTPDFTIVSGYIQFRGERVAQIIPLVPESRFLPELIEQIEKMDDKGEYQ